jgi:hypothetical protein
MKYTPLTLEQHQRRGKQVKLARQELFDFVAEVYAHYPKTGRESKAAAAALHAVDHLKNVMDDAVCRENQRAPMSESQTLTHCYYGKI